MFKLQNFMNFGQNLESLPIVILRTMNNPVVLGGGGLVFRIWAGRALLLAPVWNFMKTLGYNFGPYYGTDALI